jgi:hypothetical protein
MESLPTGHLTTAHPSILFLLSNGWDLKNIQAAGVQNGDPDFVR